MGLHLGGETFFFGRGELCLGRVKNFHLGGGIPVFPTLPLLLTYNLVTDPEIC